MISERRPHNKAVTKYYLLALVLVVVVSHWQWIFQNAYYSWGDVRFPAQFVDTWKNLFVLPSLWSSYYNGLGGIDLLLSWFPSFNVVFAGLASVGLDSRVVFRLFYLIPIPFLSTIGSFLLARHFTKSNLAGFISALVFSFNVGFLLAETGSPTISLAEGLAPLILFSYSVYLKSGKAKHGLLTGLLSFICASYEFRIFYIIAFILIFYSIFFHLFELKITVHNARRRIFLSLLPLLVVLFLSLYWILPLFFTHNLAGNALFNRSLFGDKFSSLRQSIALFSPWWTGGHGYAGGVVQPIPRQFWIIPILVILGFVVNIKNKYVYYFVFLSLLGILLTKQSDYPFPDLYSWLFTHFPGFNAYREASKFLVILYLGYSVLIGFFVSWIDRNFINSKFLHFFKLLVVVEIASLFLVNARPFVIGSIGGLFTPKHLPAEYQTLKNFLISDREYYRTLWIPTNSLWGYFDNLHPVINMHTSYFDTWGNIFSTRPDFRIMPDTSRYITNDNHQAFNFLYQNYSANLINILSIKYVIVPLKDTQNDDDMFVNYGMNDRQYILDFLNRLPFLKKIDINTPHIDVYENKSFRPLFYLTDSPPSIFDSKPASFSAVAYQSFSSTRYLIRVNHLKDPEILSFSQSYSPDWTLYMGKINPLLAIFTSKSLSSQMHSQADSTFNTFYLSPDEIKKDFAPSSYQTNPDGSINFTATLYLKSQSYVYYGTVMSVAALISILAFLIVLPRNKR